LTGNNPRFIITKESFDAVIFDLDGVITKTAKVHAAAWKELFDGFLRKWAEGHGKEFEPFDIQHDYQEYVDGKPRYDGVKSFLESRGINLSYGDPEDDSDEETICGLGKKKNKLFQKHLQEDGVEVYEHASDFLQKLRQNGFKTAIVSSSKNCMAVLQVVGLARLFDTQVDGVLSETLGLKGKPDPDIFLEAAKRLEVDRKRAIVMEDAVSGVQAGRRGGFGKVVGVDRTGHARELKENGADLTVQNLGEIEVATDGEKGAENFSSALDRLEEIFPQAVGKKLAVFLDYDGTLTPIVTRPEEARLVPDIRQTLQELAGHCFVAVISGRDLKDVQNLVGLDNLYYAGSHGFDIAGPQGHHLKNQSGKEFLPALDKAEKSLRDRLEEEIQGVQVERKKFSIAVHYRRVAEGRVPEVERVVDEVQKESGGLRKSSGKKIFELQPDIDWDKGKALLWLLEQLGLDRLDVLPFYIGDDVTDEDGFEVLKGRGVGIAVQEKLVPTAARYRLHHPDEVQKFLKALITFAKETLNE
jgi:trehalose-phosphatase